MVVGVVIVFFCYNFTMSRLSQQWDYLVQNIRVLQEVLVSRTPADITAGCQGSLDHQLQDRYEREKFYLGENTYRFKEIAANAFWNDMAETRRLVGDLTVVTAWPLCVFSVDEKKVNTLEELAKRYRNQVGVEWYLLSALNFLFFAAAALAGLLPLIISKQKRRRSPTE